MNRTKAIIATAAVPMAAVIPLSLASADSGHHPARLSAVRHHADSPARQSPTAAATRATSAATREKALATRWYANAVAAERWYAYATAANRWYAAVAANERRNATVSAAQRWYAAASHPHAAPRSGAPVVSRRTSSAPAAFTPGSGRCGGSLPPCYVMMRESKGSLTARNPSSTAAGKWQFLASTWNGYGGYSSAAQAPESVQDAKAALVWAGGAGCSAWSAC